MKPCLAFIFLSGFPLLSAAFSSPPSPLNPPAAGVALTPRGVGDHIVHLPLRTEPTLTTDHAAITAKEIASLISEIPAPHSPATSQKATASASASSLGQEAGIPSPEDIPVPARLAADEPDAASESASTNSTSPTERPTMLMDLRPDRSPNPPTPPHLLHPDQGLIVLRVPGSTGTSASSGSLPNPFDYRHSPKTESSLERKFLISGVSLGSQRVAVVNGRAVRERDRVHQVFNVYSIVRDGVIFEHNGMYFRVPRRHEVRVRLPEA